MKNLDIYSFKKMVWDYYAQQGRSFPWRHTDDPYQVMLSEIMLQQTQTHRVVPKFYSFLTAFPTLDSLANASLKEVLLQWQGLGYNRRGMYLHQAAQQIVQRYAGIIPDAPEILITLPGIGSYTASSIVTFAYNKPTVFIETNIRTVFIHCFFAGSDKVHDKDIFPLIAQAVDTVNPRDWYYALMDYGVMLKKLLPNPSRRSKHHTIQSPFEGSDRQIRGMILKFLAQAQEIILLHELVEKIQKDPVRVQAILEQMIQEKILKRVSDTISINDFSP